MFIQKPYLQLKEIATFETLYLLRKTLKNGHKNFKTSKSPQTQGAALATGRKSRTKHTAKNLLYY